MTTKPATAALGRNKIASDFANAFAADFEAHGAETIKTLRETNPAVYLRLAAAIEPQDEDILQPPLPEFWDHDETMLKRIAVLDEILTLAGNDPAKVKEVIEIRTKEGRLLDLDGLSAQEGEGGE
ncbi:MAG: hypothetical protein K8S25_14340 [Alphaproteobacteria bacterium]|nr:hypothetical protein [Alphaproteobacteria bacterium]